MKFVLIIFNIFFNFMNIQSLKLNIAKLVLGYLIECNYPNTAQTFMNECILLHDNSNILSDAIYNSEDKLVSIVEDYFESKKYAFIKSCDYMKSNGIKLKDILTVLCDKNENRNSNICNNKENQINKRRNSRKRKVDVSCTENAIYFNNSQAKNLTLDVNSLAPMADFMAYNINKSVPTFQPLVPKSYIQIQNDYHTDQWKTGIDSKNLDNNADNFQDIFLETLESIYPSSSAIGKPIKRTDSLNTPEKKVYLPDSQQFSLGDSEKPHCNNEIFNCSQTKDNKEGVNLNNLWDSIFNENSEPELFQVSNEPSLQQVSSDFGSQKSFMNVAKIKNGNIEKIQYNKNCVNSSSLSVLEKEKILKSVDLNKVIEALKNNRK